MDRAHPSGYREVPLSGRLAEFRKALQDEIDAARQNEAGAAIPLVNGRCIAQIGGNYQYAFDIENLLNLPGDAPGDLYVPGNPPQEVIIVSVEGMALTLSVPANLGTTIPNARLQSNLAHLMRKLIDRIEALAIASNPIGDRILSDLPSIGIPVPLSELSEWNALRDGDKRLNEQQLRALALSLGRNVTFIWGPPGTGKTQTIGAIGEHLYQRQRSGLV